MLTALILAVCLTPPLFDGSGPSCTPARQDIECGCSECFTWTPAIGATRYEVLRRNQDGTSGWIGAPARHGGFIDTEDGTPVPLELETQWCVAKDLRMPIEGRLYVYEVRACNAWGCSTWSGAAGSSVNYRAAPYWCFAGGLHVPCP
jgi:hypothetical protein